MRFGALVAWDFFLPPMAGLFVLRASPASKNSPYKTHRKTGFGSDPCFLRRDALELVAVSAWLSAQSLRALADDDGHHDKRRHGVGPPPTESRVEGEASE